MKKFIYENKKMIKYASLSILLLIIVLSIVLVIEALKEDELDVFNNTVLATIENVKRQDITGEYLLIKFPDEDNLLSKNGKLKLSNGKKYDEFKYGYIIIYKNGLYNFKLSDGKYCATRDYTDEKVEVDISSPCEDYNVVYK